MPQTLRKCKHTSLHLDPSPNASKARFKRPSKQQRIRAVSHNAQPLTPIALFDDATTFPAPLVLPDDDLDLDPEYPAQSVQEWREDEERNPITHTRKTIYLVASPSITEEMRPMNDWNNSHTIQEREIQLADLKTYISAFYHGMSVKILPQKFTWQAWEHEANKPKYNGKRLKPNHQQLIGLATPHNTLIGVRCRLSPDKIMQLNLDDILDALAETVPADAYAIMMLLHQDMYEGDDEIFTGGRAYGGSRIAVVSSFRDHPARLSSDIHRWPASHCASYVSAICGTTNKLTSISSGAMGAAVRAVAELSDTPDEYGEWFSRVAQTAAHELGHCFGLDHCVYYACVMQGCGSSGEALRQPGYLCPVCLEKVAWGIGSVVKGWEDEGVRREYEMRRYEAMRRVCERWAEGGSVYWVGYGVWLGEVIKLYGAC
ncbi:metalloproteases (zincins), catalytic [Pochonia chlamydosporia 170]|uniref:Metalloproteases (Zincins), catalytic n=1 Tax=Pochonia chlamydosporia 170 TaxID=1380566 RepID=A0A179FQ41_METCM|nr:metalloproteases (zincins), catalytic [Pochonia chlamydosporia 170]OAQ67704.2 metalloproteases (zincins), catalytic [Pochonia chlamydosporia 170]